MAEKEKKKRPEIRVNDIDELLFQKIKTHADKNMRSLSNEMKFIALEYFQKYRSKQNGF